MSVERLFERVDPEEIRTLREEYNRASNIKIPPGPNWWCAECGEEGDHHEQTLREHYEQDHGGFPPDRP